MRTLRTLDLGACSQIRLSRAMCVMLPASFPVPVIAAHICTQICTRHPFEPTPRISITSNACTDQCATRETMFLHLLRKTSQSSTCCSPNLFSFLIVSLSKLDLTHIQGTKASMACLSRSTSSTFLITSQRLLFHFLKIPLLLGGPRTGLRAFWRLFCVFMIDGD
jgi:hypothetical protein